MPMNFGVSFAYEPTQSIATKGMTRQTPANTRVRVTTGGPARPPACCWDTELSSIFQPVKNVREGKRKLREPPPGPGRVDNAGPSRGPTLGDPALPADDQRRNLTRPLNTRSYSPR